MINKKIQIVDTKKSITNQSGIVMAYAANTN